MTKPKELVAKWPPKEKFNLEGCKLFNISVFFLIFFFFSTIGNRLKTIKTDKQLDRYIDWPSYNYWPMLSENSDKYKPIINLYINW